MSIESKVDVLRQDFALLDERQLIDIARNDTHALSFLYRCHYSAIFGYVYRRIGNANDTNDVVAEVFVSMVRYLPRFRWTGVPFKCWLLRIANTQINRWIRKRRWASLWQSFNESLHNTSIQASVSEEHLEQVRIALTALPICYQTALALHYFEDLSVETISQILNCRPGTVKSRLSRGRELLRKKLSYQEEKNSNERRTIGKLSENIEV